MGPFSPGSIKSSSIPRGKQKLNDVLLGSRLSPVSHRRNDGSLNLPRFREGKEKQKMNVKNNNFVNKMNMIMPIEKIRQNTFRRRFNKEESKEKAEKWEKDYKKKQQLKHNFHHNHDYFKDTKMKSKEYSLVKPDNANNYSIVEIETFEIRNYLKSREELC